jgi:hypothetical protein
VIIKISPADLVSSRQSGALRSLLWTDRIALRRAEEEGADTGFRLRATTK